LVLIALMSSKSKRTYRVTAKTGWAGLDTRVETRETIM
jgi:hypothetical protein